MLDFLIVQTFWLSTMLIGGALLLKYCNARSNKTVTWFASLPVFAMLPIVFAMAVGWLALVVVPSYVFSLSLWFLGVFYAASSVASLVYLVACRRQLVGTIKPRLKLSKRQIFVGLGLGIVLLLDFAFASKHGASIDNADVYIQLSKVRHMFDTSHITLTDPYFGYNGLVDYRYSANVLNALQALCARFGGVQPLDVYWYSYGFYRLLMWAVIFLMVWTFAAKKHRSLLSSLVIVLGPLTYNDYFMYIELSDRVVLLWIGLVIVGIKLLLEKKGPALLYLGVILIALTHGLSALITLGFLVLLGAVLLFTRRLDKSLFRTLFIASAILAIPVVVNILSPNHIASNPNYFNALPISGGELRYSHYGPLTIVEPKTFVWRYLIGSIFLIVCMYQLHRVADRKLRLIFFGLLCVAFTLTFSTLLLGVIGVFYFVYYASNKFAVRWFMLLLAAYFALVAYNPLFIALVHTKIPPWIIARFNEFNLLSIVGPIVGAFVVFVLPLINWNYKRAVIPAVMYLVFIMFYYIPTYNFDYHPSDPIYQRGSTMINLRIKKELQQIQSFMSDQNNAIVYANDYDMPSKLPVVSSANVISMTGVNAVPSANLMLRGDCVWRLYWDVADKDLAASRVTTIVANRDDEDYNRRLRQNPHLTYIRQDDRSNLYVVKPIESSQESICAIPRGQ